MKRCTNCPTPKLCVGSLRCQRSQAEEEAWARRSAAACSRIVGYRLQNGTDVAQLFFLPGIPSQRTLDQMADLIADGWMVTEIIYSENATGEARADNAAPPPPTTL